MTTGSASSRSHAGLATLGAASVEVVRDVLAEIQSAILPLVPQLDTLRWVFIVVALAGVAVVIYARLEDWKLGTTMIATMLGEIAAIPLVRLILLYGAVAIATLQFLLSIRRAGEHPGHLAERLETMQQTNDVQRRMLQAPACRPRDRDDPADRLRDRRF